MAALDLYRLVYTSFKQPICDEGEIQRILKSARAKNPAMGITGVLIHSDSRFLQYLEGEKEQLKLLFELIQNDKRHTAVVERNFEPISERAFPNWLMAYKDIALANVTFDTRVTDEDIQKFEDIVKGDLDFSNSGLRLLKLFVESK